MQQHVISARMCLEIRFIDSILLLNEVIKEKEAHQAMHLFQANNYWSEEVLLSDAALCFFLERNTADTHPAAPTPNSTNQRVRSLLSPV